MNLTKEQREAIEWAILQAEGARSDRFARLHGGALRSLLDAPSADDAGVIGILRKLYVEFAKDDPNRPHEYTEGALDALEIAEQSILADLAPEDAPSTAQGVTTGAFKLIPKAMEDAAEAAMASPTWTYTQLWNAMSAAKPASVDVQPASGVDVWRPIETAPKDGRTLLIGYPNQLGNWRTTRGQWMSDDYIAEYWEEPENGEAGWFETCVEADDHPNCWSISPTHWMPLPAEPAAIAQRAKDKS